MSQTSSTSKTSQTSHTSQTDTSGKNELDKQNKLMKTNFRLKLKPMKLGLWVKQTKDKQIAIKSYKHRSFGLK